MAPRLGSSIWNFVRALFGRQLPPEHRRGRHSGDDLAHDVREGMGRLGAAAPHGGVIGGAGYRYFEDKNDAGKNTK